MGYRYSIVAIRGPLETLLDALGATPTGEVYDFADTGWHAWEHEGWSVVLASGSNYFLALTHELAQSVPADDGLWFLASDTVMCAELHRWGSEAWSVVYEGTNGVSDYQITGTPPEGLLAALEHSREEQRTTDEPDLDYLYSGVAAALRVLVGRTGTQFESAPVYRQLACDRRSPEPPKPESPTPQAPRSWWERIFGR